MRIIVFFDLPVVTQTNRREYTQFRKSLIKQGYLMLQESVYCKLVPNSNVADAAIEKLKKIKPKEGLIQALRVTEKQFEKMDFIVGEKKTTVLDTDDKLVII